MNTADNFPRAAPKSKTMLGKADAFVWHRRRCIDGLITSTETSSNGLRALQRKIEELRAVSGSPSVALQALATLMLEKIDELVVTLEMQQRKMTSQVVFAQDRAPIDALLDDTRRLRLQARTLLGRDREVPPGVA